MFLRSASPLFMATGFMTALGGCTRVGGESEVSRSHPSQMTPPPAVSQAPRNLPDAGAVDAGAPAREDPMRNWIRIRVGQPLRNPDSARPAVDFSNKAYALDGIEYLCPTPPAVTRATGPQGQGRGAWTVSLENCRPAPEATNGPANIRYLQTQRQMSRPYVVTRGEPLTRPYTADAGDEENTLPWEILPYVDRAGNIYVIDGTEEDDNLYCPRIPEVRPTGRSSTIVRRGRTITVHSIYNIGTNICQSHSWVGRSREIWEENQRRVEENQRIEAENRRRAAEDQRRTDAETQSALDESLRREGISRAVSDNVVFYGFAIFLNLLLFQFLRKDRT